MPNTTTSTTTVQSGGVGFAGLLTILFIGLKLTGFIAWSWLWVLSPLWIVAALVVAVLLVVGLCMLLAAAVTASIDASQKRRRRKELAAKGIVLDR